MNFRVFVIMDINEKFYVIDVRFEEEFEVIFYLDKLKNVFVKCNLLILFYYFLIKFILLIMKMLLKDYLFDILIFFRYIF